MTGAGAATLAPSAAFAEVCDTLRPNWNGAPTSVWAETLHLLISPIGIVLLVASALALLRRSHWGGLIVVVLWAGYLTLITMAASDIQKLARIEGCVGSPVLFIGIAAAICIAIVLYTAPEKAPRSNGES